jgi:hypothetical protein
VRVLGDGSSHGFGARGGGALLGFGDALIDPFAGDYASGAT